jgi:hypothetical protein
MPKKSDNNTAREPEVIAEFTLLGVSAKIVIFENPDGTWQGQYRNSKGYVIAGGEAPNRRQVLRDCLRLLKGHGAVIISNLLAEVDK